MASVNTRAFWLTAQTAQTDQYRRGACSSHPKRVSWRSRLVSCPFKCSSRDSAAAVAVLLPTRRQGTSVSACFASRANHELHYKQHCNAACSYFTIKALCSDLTRVLGDLLRTFPLLGHRGHSAELKELVGPLSSCNCSAVSNLLNSFGTFIASASMSVHLRPVHLASSGLSRKVLAWLPATSTSMRPLRKIN